MSFLTPTSLPRRLESRKCSNIQYNARLIEDWIPAFTGMTVCDAVTAKVRFVLIFLPLLTFSPTAYSSPWDEVRFDSLASGVTYEIDSGTGFYINSENIITNRHVVEQCLNIAVRGAVLPQKATLVTIDDELDLALLKVETPSLRIPYMRINYDEVAIGDILFTIGYPLDSSQTGQYVIKQTEVISVSPRTENTKFSNIQFIDTIDHGNSGGPLLDKNSNIVGVVTAKITRYDPANPDKTTTVGMAIGLDGLIAFLQRNNIFYASNATYDIFTNYNVDRLVKDYVVNIHCVKGKK